MDKQNSKNYFQTIDSETLMSTSIEPINFIVQGFIPQGLHILAGSAKIGKSWLVLWMCLQVAKGEKVWKFETTQGTVLYLCLEDSLARIQNRLFDITEDAHPALHFSTMANTLGDGLETQIENFVKERTDTSLIVIDTLQCIRHISKDTNSYANDYREIRLLKAIADKYKIAILLVHHFRKTNDADPVNMISGTTGISGGVDSAFTLAKDKRSGNDAVLQCVGRDIEYRDLEIRFNKKTHIWELVSDSVTQPGKFMDNTISLLCEFMKTEKEFIGSSTELLEKLKPLGVTNLIPNTLSKKLVQNKSELEDMGVLFAAKRTNGKRIIELACCSDDSAESDDRNRMGASPEIVDPVVTVDPAPLLEVVS